MRMKRPLAMLLCAAMLCALGWTWQPIGALAVSYVNIGGQAITVGTPYYRDGVTYGSDPVSDGGWTAWFTGGALRLRNLGQTGISDLGIEIPDDSAAFSILLEGTANAYTLASTSTSSAMIGQNLVFTGNGALSVQTGGENDPTPRYGVKADAITLQGGASLTAAGYSGATSVCVTTPDWSQYTITAGTQQSGANAALVTSAEYTANWDDYRYVRFAAIPQPVPPAPPAPKTGDGTPIWLLCVLTLLSGAGLIAAKRRKA